MNCPLAEARGNSSQGLFKPGAIQAHADFSAFRFLESSSFLSC
jgi:hypothetical protein